tara:strand:- start:34 stop:333 length:300 start_codon:yes stop_codon:yes gene_type:complete
MKIFKIIFLLLILIQINNCTNFNEAMSGKSKTTDEFLVKKKDPLALPPKFEELPLPESQKQDKEKSIEKMLGSKSDSSGKSENISNLENMVLKELRKNN